MPKTLILFHGAGDDVATIAEAVAEGVRSVRFAEVDLRRLSEPAGSASTGDRQTLTTVDELAGYDGLVLGTAARDAMPGAVTKLLAEAEALRQRGGLTLSVGSAFVAGATDDGPRWSLLRSLGGLGLVLVPTGGPSPEEGRKQGHRVAHVVSWITHARSHHH